MQLQDTIRSEGPSSNTETINKLRSLAGASEGTEVATAPGSEVDAIFTDPEPGRVGMTEEEARRAYGNQIKVATFDVKYSGKATEEGETQGFIKLIADIRDKRLLGAAILAVEGGELVASCITLMNSGADLTRIRDGIYIHPTLSEAVQSAVVALNL